MANICYSKKVQDKQQGEKAHRALSRGNQGKAAESPLPVESHRAAYLIPLASNTNKYEVLRYSPGDSVVKNPAANIEDTSSIPGSGRSPGEGSGSPLQYSCLGHPTDRGAWWATVYGVSKSWTQLSN